MGILSKLPNHIEWSWYHSLLRKMFHLMMSKNITLWDTQYSVFVVVMLSIPYLIKGINEKNIWVTCKINPKYPSIIIKTTHSCFFAPKSHYIYIHSFWHNILRHVLVKPVTPSISIIPLIVGARQIVTVVYVVGAVVGRVIIAGATVAEVTV